MEWEQSNLKYRIRINYVYKLTKRSSDFEGYKKATDLPYQWFRPALKKSKKKS